jgi:hypothetical protein
MIKLNDVTLVAVATTEVEATVKALDYSTLGIEFSSIKLFSHLMPDNLSKNIEFIQINPFPNVGEWGRFVVFDLHKYISTKHIILVHSDGFVVHPDMWRQEFLDFDYIGAPWPLPEDDISFRDYYGNIIRVGNSVGLRSLKMLKLPSELGLSWDADDHGNFHEDIFLCVTNRHILQKHGLEFAPLSVAKYFSHERPIKEISGIKPFAFHKWMGSNATFPRFTEEPKRPTYFQKYKRKFLKLYKSLK